MVHQRFQLPSGIGFLYAGSRSRGTLKLPFTLVNFLMNGIFLKMQYDGSPPFYFSVESPSAIRRGETLGIRLMAINNLKEEVMALIVLEASDDYKFVETEEDGEVEHYRPQLVGGEQHHMVAVRMQIHLLNKVTKFDQYHRLKPSLCGKCIYLLPPRWSKVP